MTCIESSTKPQASEIVSQDPTHQYDVDQLRDLLDLLEGFSSNDQRARYLLSCNWMRDRGDAASQRLKDWFAAQPAGVQHVVRIMPAAADVLAIAEHHGTAFVEEDGWVNTLIPYPGGSTVVYKAPTGSAVS